PVVLTLHDQWFMTGDCAYTYDCTRWTKNCGNCPQASMTRFEDRYAIGGRDTTRINLALKRLSTWAVPAPRMAVVCPSRWLLKCAQQARHLKRYEFHHIEYGIDLDVYHPLNKTECRKEFVLPLAKRLIFTAAVNLHDRRKNFGVVDEFLRSGSWPRDAILVVAGRLRDEEKRTYEGLPVVFLGYLQDRERMAKALSACDCSLVLSRADNLPYTCLEALGCGCPVIGSNVGGIPEIVEDGVTGLVLPSSCSPADLGKAIHSVCGNPMPWLSEMSHRAREKAERCYGLARSVERYTRLFEKMVARCE
ncbi:MAG: glycosyltransferase, partial [Deltaproteobacteria bacterium]